MNKKSVISLIIIILIFSAIVHSYNNSKVFKINKNKINKILYSTNAGQDDKPLTCDLTGILNKEDIYAIIAEINNGILIPDNIDIVGMPSECIDVLVIDDRWFSISNQGEDVFIVRYSINPISNNYDDYKHTTFKSKVLQSYFSKWREISKHLPPIDK